jgi:hypothetical protein
MTMAMAMAEKQTKADFGANKGTLLLFWVGCVCPCACYMGLWIIWVSKLAKCPLICLADLAGDLVILPLRSPAMT